jgi:hypothetical protein
MKTCTPSDTQLDFVSLCIAEPRLLELEARARAIKDDGQTRRFCANHRWHGCIGCDVCYGGLEQALTRLVGWGAETPELRSEATYDVAYDHLIRLLPPCRNCMCL